jgi:hypothetical protein
MVEYTYQPVARLKVHERVIENKGKRAPVRKWRVPQIRIANKYLELAGFKKGQWVLVTAPRAGTLVITIEQKKRRLG